VSHGLATRARLFERAQAALCSNVLGHFLPPSVHLPGRKRVNEVPQTNKRQVQRRGARTAIVGIFLIPLP
jgi:hypothetical protein